MRHTVGMARRRHVIWVLSLSFWTAVGLLCGLQIWISMIDHGHALWRVLTYQVLIWTVWFVFAPAIGWMARRFPLLPPRNGAVVAHVVAALAVAATHTLWWAMWLVELRPYDAMGVHQFRDAVRSLAISGLPLQLIFYCGVLAAHYAVEYYDKYRERSRAAARLETSLVESRLHALELQIRPHFLFNTLNSISALVRTSRDRDAIGMIAGLSDLLRYSLDHAGEQRVGLAAELAITARYLEIERLRYPDRLTYEIEAASDVRGGAVPTLLLQPLAENAIRHGVARLASPGRVTIRAVREGARLRIDVFNTGSLAADHRAGIGLRNTLERLRFLYGGDHSFELRAEHGGVLARVSLPWSEAA